MRVLIGRQMSGNVIGCLLKGGKGQGHKTWRCSYVEDIVRSYWKGRKVNTSLSESVQPKAQLLVNFSPVQVIRLSYDTSLESGFMQ